MKIPTLKFLTQPSPGVPVRGYLTTDTPGDLEKARHGPLPAALVIDVAFLDPLRHFSDSILDRGRKHPAKGLARSLLGQPGIPLIQGSYRHSGQLVRSVRRLLDNALKAGDRNLYLIGVEEGLFQEIWRKAGETLEASPTENIRRLPHPKVESSSDIL